MTFSHKTVLLEETAEFLRLAGKKGLWVDATLGFGGHSERILKDMSPEAFLIGIDQDDRALEYATDRLKGFSNFKAIKGNFKDLEKIVHEQGSLSISGIVYDLGVSSMQLDDGTRGFSFMKDAPLDMRMDETSPLSADDVVNRYNRADLERVIKEYGEEGYYAKIADFIMKSRPVKGTLELAEIIKKAKFGKEKIHPATKVFQAIRIEVNNELGALEKSIKSAVSLLVPGGRMCVISFHSLEDRIVKNFIREKSHGCDCGYRPCICHKIKELEAVTKKPVTASFEETRQNPRARSAKLRCAEKL